MERVELRCVSALQSEYICLTRGSIGSVVCFLVGLLIVWLREDSGAFSVLLKYFYRRSEFRF